MQPSPLIAGFLREAAVLLRGRFGPRLRFVRLFGSWARGQATEDSDVDVAVVVEGLSHPERQEIVALLYPLEERLDLFVSPLVVSGEHFDELLRRGQSVAQDVLREGVSA